MARESISKIAYKTLQQSKSIAGFAHKQISSRLMNFILPDSKLENFDIDKNLLQQIQNSMDLLREEDWNDAENNIYPKKLLFDEPWLRYLTQYPKIWLDMPITWERRRLSQSSCSYGFQGQNQIRNLHCYIVWLALHFLVPRTTKRR